MGDIRCSGIERHFPSDGPGALRMHALVRVQVANRE